MRLRVARVTLEVNNESTTFESILLLDYDGTTSTTSTSINFDPPVSMLPFHSRGGGAVTNLETNSDWFRFAI